MGTESTLLEQQQWLVIDAGATRVRVAPVCFYEIAQLAGPVMVECFASDQAAARVKQAASLVNRAGQAIGWKPPFRLGLAWAGAPSADGLGTVAARYGPAIPDLVARLADLVSLQVRPYLHSDARAAVEGAAIMHKFSSAYALISGSGLGEAYFENGRSWTRDEFQAKLGRAADWHYKGNDGESWLRASAWRDQSPELYREALGSLIEHRLRIVGPEVIILGGHFKEWFVKGWLHNEACTPRLLCLESEAALLGCVQLEYRRIMGEKS